MWRAALLRQRGNVGPHGLGAQVQRALGGKVCCGFGNAHHAAQLQPGQWRHGQRQCARFFGGHACFVGAAIHIQLQAHLQGRQVGRALLGQALGNFQAVNGVRPVKVLGHQAGFVALDGANAVPLQLRRQRGRQGLHAGDFVHAFLEVVFAKRALACLGGFEHGLGRKGFGDGQQGHAVGRARRLGAGLGHALVHELELVGNRGHNQCQKKCGQQCGRKGH